MKSFKDIRNDINEGSMDKMSLQDIWVDFTNTRYISDQGYGIGYGNPKWNDKKADVIFKFVTQKFGKKVADDMADYGATRTYKDEYADEKETKDAEKHMAKLAKKHGIKESTNDITESKKEDITDLEALLKNPDPKVAKNYGGLPGYKKMLQSKIDKLKESNEVLDEAKNKLARLSSNAKIRTVGFTEIKEDDKILEISHSGNMGNSIEGSVDPNITRIGLPTIAKLKQRFTNYYEDGSPSYWWVIQFKKPKKGDYILEESNEDVVEVEEAMSRAARIKRGKIMKRLQPKIKRAKEKAAKKKASPDVIDKRAVKQAKEVLIKKWLKGKSKGDVPFAERERIEAKLKKSKKAIDRIKKKFIKTIRKQEADKFKKEDVELNTTD